MSSLPSVASLLSETKDKEQQENNLAFHVQTEENMQVITNKNCLLCWDKKIKI